MTGKGELVHPKDENSIAISGLGCRKTFGDIGRATCPLRYILVGRKQLSHYVGSPFPVFKANLAFPERLD